MYCKRCCWLLKSAVRNQICRLSTARIRYTIKYLKDGLILTQKEGKGTMQTKDSEEVVARFGAKLI